MPGPMKLNPETRLALDAIRHSDEPSPVYGLESDRAIELLREVTEPMFEGAALPAAVLMQVRWFVLELARLFRTRYGYALAFQLELLLRKWHDFGVEPNTLQFIVTEVARHVGEGKSGRARIEDARQIAECKVQNAKSGDAETRAAGNED